jgi:tetratricopeptide (TPR) repeat protein
MEAQFKHINLFEAYTEGTLSNVEVSAFEARLRNDNEFKIEFEAFQEVEKGIKQHFRTEVKNKFKQIDSEIDKETKVIPIHPKKKLSKFYLATASAAAISIIGIVFHFSTQNNYQELAQQNWPYEEGLPVKMEENGIYDAAMNAFKQEKWCEAESCLLKNNSDTAYYYLGLINFEQHDYKKAIAFFLKVKVGSEWFEQCEYRLALNYLCLNDLNKAKEIFKKIVISNSLYAKQTVTILKLL